MKKFILGIIFVLTFSFQANANSLKIIVNIPYLTPKNAPIYISNNLSGCNWKVDCKKLIEISPQVFSTTIKNPRYPLEFKVNRGSWTTQAASANGNLLSNIKIQSQPENNIFVLNIRNWTDQKSHGESGKIITLRNFPIEILNDKRTVRIYLPTGYEKSQKEFPVIYMHDGQNIFNYKDSSFGHEWTVDETLEFLALNEKLRKAIVVGIDSGKDRNGEYHYTRKGNLYGQFLTAVLKPFIDNNFRTLPNRENTYLMGSSMGALISFTLLWSFPEVFSKAAGLSLPAHAHDYETYKFLSGSPNAPQDVSFYMDHGDWAGDATYLGPAKKFYNDLINVYNFPKKLLKYEVFPYAGHSETDWARRLPNALKFLLIQSK